MRATATLTKTHAIALSRLIEAMRPDWDFAGIMAALRDRTPPGAPFADIAKAMIECAADPTAETPGALSNPVYWPDWQPESDPNEAARRRTREIHDRRVLDEARWALANRDPKSHHRGYLAATAALQAQDGTP